MRVPSPAQLQRLQRIQRQLVKEMPEQERKQHQALVRERTITEANGRHSHDPDDLLRWHPLGWVGIYGLMVLIFPLAVWFVLGLLIKADPPKFFWYQTLAMLSALCEVYFEFEFGFGLGHVAFLISLIYSFATYTEEGK